MQTFPKNFLFLISSWLLLDSCTPKMFKDLGQAGATFTSDKTKLFRSGVKESLVYKTNIKYKDKEFSSLAYVNEINDSVFKIVLLTSFGNTLLEAKISKEKFIVNNVISYLNRKPILNLFEKDWRLVLSGNLNHEIPLSYSSAKAEEQVFDYQHGRVNNLYYYNLKQESLTQIESYKGKTKKVIVTISSFKDSLPEKFSIEHPSLKLKLDMTLLKKVNNDSAE